MQSVLCLPRRGLLSGRFSQDPGLFWLAPLPLLETDGAPRPGKGGWGSGLRCSRKLQCAANNKPVPVFRNSTRACDGASYCLLRAAQNEAGLSAGLGVTFFNSHKHPPNNRKFVEQSWKTSSLRGVSHQYQTKHQFVKLPAGEGS